MIKKINKKIINKDRARGFTMIETLVAISILLLSIAAPITIAQKGLSSAGFVKNQITAFYLAQDAMEYAKNVRDENIIAGNQWRNGLNACSSDLCIFDVINDTITVCGGNCDNLRQDPVSGLFGYNPSWPETIFRRYISAQNINGDETQMTVTVSWDEKGSTKNIEIKENILNWSDD